MFIYLCWFDRLFRTYEGNILLKDSYIVMYISLKLSVGIFFSTLTGVLQKFVMGAKLAKSRGRRRKVCKNYQKYKTI